MRTIGELIDTLQGLNPELPVMMGEATGLGFTSWRGDYAEVTITHGDSFVGDGVRNTIKHGYTYTEADNPETVPAATTVGELLAVAERVADGGVLTGYKGGAYTMRRSTTIWADPYGDAFGSQLGGISIRDGVVVLSRIVKTYGRD